MPASIAFTSKTATSITVAVTGRDTGNYANLDVQYSSRPDFSFVPSPIYGIATSDSVILSALNQAAVYYIRVRQRSAAGVVDAWSNVLAIYTVVANARSTGPAALMVTPAIVVKPAHFNSIAGSGSISAGRVVKNLLTDSPLEQYWSTGTIIEFETSGEPIDTFALLDTNLPEGATWSITGSGTQGTLGSGETLQSSTPFRASANMPGRSGYHGLIKLAAPSSYAWHRITIGGTSPPGGLRTMTYLVAGRARMAKNIAADKVEGALDYGSIERLRDGTPDRRRGFRARRVEFEIALMTEAQWETQFADLARAAGLTDPMLVVPNMRSGAFLHDRILYGPLAQNRVQQPFAPRFSQQFTCESLI